MDTEKTAYETIFVLGIVGLLFSVFTSSFAFTSYSILDEASEVAIANLGVLIVSIILVAFGFYKLKN